MCSDTPHYTDAGAPDGEAARSISTEAKVWDETGHHGGLCERVEDILTKVVPVVREVTELDLPPLVVFRIVDPETWQAESEADLTELVGRYRQQLPRWKAPAINVMERMVVSRLREVAPLLGGVLVMGATTAVGPVGLSSRTMLVPEALEHSGALHPGSHYLTQVVAHELVHHAQNLATGRRKVWADSIPAALLGTTAIKLVEEGHAYWADQEVTRRLFAEPKDIRTAPSSVRSDAYEAALKDKRIARMRRRDTYAEGRRLVAAAIDAVGISPFNQVWTDVELLPTKHELRQHEKWVGRLSGLR
ncbi:zinc-dependent metalloprotease [Streptomyces sp. NBC_01438]|uniref:zinc-dependent metalloprotease n=1 Tax=unclassified Streptomyces TaxID=2593676 RepID=UPI00325556F7